MGETISKRIKNELMKCSCESALYHKLIEYLSKEKSFSLGERNMILNSMILTEEV